MLEILDCPNNGKAFFLCGTVIFSRLRKSLADTAHQPSFPILPLGQHGTQTFIRGIGVQAKGMLKLGNVVMEGDASFSFSIEGLLAFRSPHPWMILHEQMVQWSGDLYESLYKSLVVSSKAHKTSCLSDSGRRQDVLDGFEVSWSLALPFPPRPHVPRRIHPLAPGCTTQD